MRSFIKYVLERLVQIFILLVLIWTVFSAKAQFKWVNYNQLNLRYSEFYDTFPKDLYNGKLKGKNNFSDFNEKEKSYARRYFNLYSEEYWLYLENMIPKEMFEVRIKNGVSVNLKRYPLLKDGGFHYREARDRFDRLKS